MIATKTTVTTTIVISITGKVTAQVTSELVLESTDVLAVVVIAALAPGAKDTKIKLEE